LGTVQQKLTASEPLPTGKHKLGVSFEIKGRDATNSPVGTAKLVVDGKEVASDDIKTQPGFFGLEGVVTVGRDTGRPASDEYSSPDSFRGGTVEKVTVTVRGKPHTDPEQQAKMAQSRD
jgi:hypothetical protein